MSKSLPLIVRLAALVVVCWGLIHAKSFLLPIIVAALLALTLMPLVRWLRRLRCPEWLAVTIATVVFLLPFAVLISILAREARALIQDWAHIRVSAEALLQSALAWPPLQVFHFDELSLEDVANRLGDKASEGLGFALAGLSLFFTAGSQVVLVLFFAIMMLSARRHLREAFERILRARTTFDTGKVLDESVAIIEQFLLARLFIILFVAGADFVLLEAFRMPFAVSLAVLQGVMTLIPAIGFILGLVPLALIAAAQGGSTWWLVGVVASVWAVSSLQDHVLTPKLVGQRLNLNFFVTYVGLFAGERLWGIWGMFLAIPVLGIARILLTATPETEVYGALIQDRATSKKTT